MDAARQSWCGFDEFEGFLEVVLTYSIVANTIPNGQCCIARGAEVMDKGWQQRSQLLVCQSVLANTHRTKVASANRRRQHLLKQCLSRKATKFKHVSGCLQVVPFPGK
eukprot:3786195-Amphidinium_carterae.1